MAALTASRAPGTAETTARGSAAEQRAAAHGPSVSGDAPYRTELPPLRTRKAAKDADGAVGGAVPASVFAAYRHAEAELARTTPGCRLRWQLLAAIGQVESGQARGGRVTADGTTLTPILGPRLDGNGFAAIGDSDGGAYDGDTAYDRAVGPMQFIPSTWAGWSADGNGDGQADPHNVYDAALAAGHYLCAGGRDLSDPDDLGAAILGYNHSRAYLRTVLAWYAYFLEGHRVVPDDSAASDVRTRPSPHPKGPKSPGPKASRASRPASPHRSSAPPADGGARTQPAPSPSATETAATTAQPLIPLPSPDVELPEDGGLPTGDPLTGINDPN
jgi:membrane-bound lytic murein transglycosylase B